ncbi:MAG TPA: hypothetical protein VEO74_17005 [Thermoanaerobaculia bacterium]|nr:hypothetical protein [Thermoanaerobaculia bacterium]
MRIKILVVLFIFVPALSFAQRNAARSQVVRSYDLITPPGSPTFGVAHVEDIKIGDRRQIHTIVSTNEGSGEFTFDGRTIEMGDGYTVVRETLADTRGVLVARLTASTPEGSAESAIIVANRKTGEVTSIGVDRYALLLQGSHDVRIINTVLPLVAPVTHLAAGLAPRVLDDCTSATVALVASTLGLEYTCATGNVAGCYAAISGWLLIVDRVASSCPSTPYGDGTIGWG